MAKFTKDELHGLKKLGDSLKVKDAEDFAGFIRRNPSIKLIRKYVNGWLIDIPAKDLETVLANAKKDRLEIKKSSKSSGKYILVGWDGSNEYYIS